MSTKSPFNPKPELLCHYCLLGLKYALAGDPESVESIEFLTERARSLQWDDPGFIRMSEEMRNGVSLLTAAELASFDFAPLVYAYKEKMAEAEELITMWGPAIKQWQEHERRHDEWTSKMCALHLRMRAQLDLLGAEVSEFELPKP